MTSLIVSSYCRVSILPTYYVPKDGPLSSYKEYVSMLPNIDHPEAFGQHPNADIQSQIQETRLMFDTLLSLQPQISAAAGVSREDKVSPKRYLNMSSGFPPMSDTNLAVQPQKMARDLKFRI